jgi:hypothetical protein
VTPWRHSATGVWSLVFPIIYDRASGLLRNLGFLVYRSNQRLVVPLSVRLYIHHPALLY